jgi:hypothetical protein
MGCSEDGVVVQHRVGTRAGERFWRNGVIQATKKGVIDLQFAL